jgi:hypothetical protein
MRNIILGQSVPLLSEINRALGKKKMLLWDKNTAVKSTVFRDVEPCSPVGVTLSRGERTTSVFRVEDNKTSK